MGTTRSSTQVVEIGAPLIQSPSGSIQLALPEQPASSSSVMGGPTVKREIQQKKPTLRQLAVTLMQPPKKVGPAPAVWQSIQSIIMASYLNLLLICIPISWVLNFASPDERTLVFVFSFLAIIPLAKLLAFATSELSMRVGETLAGLMNITSGNIVELIVAIIALAKCELGIVQSSLVGSILSNLLLMLGMCFFAGGLRFSEQGFGLIMAQMNPSLLTISVIAVLLPGAFVVALQGSSFDPNTIDHSILKMSFGVAVILLFVYTSYLFFQLFSHKSLYQDDGEEIMGSRKYSENPFNVKKSHRSERATMPQYTETPLVESPPSSRPQSHFSASGNRTIHAVQPISDPEAAHAVTSMLLEEETQEPQTSVSVSLVLLVAVTVLIAVTLAFLVDSISGLTDAGGISKEFVAVILLPIVGKAAELPEHATTVMESVRDRLTLSVGVAVGSSIQMALFVIPFIVILGWILGKPLTLLFDPFQSIVMFLSVLIVNYAIQDGKSNWLKGMILLCLYLALCVAFWYYPGTDPVLGC